MKIRGTAAHIYEKYQSLARDAQASGDRIIAENYLQHAEHYFRMMLAADGPAAMQNRMNQGPGRPPMQGGVNGQHTEGDEGQAETGTTSAHDSGGANGRAHPAEEQHGHGNGQSRQPSVQAAEESLPNGESHTYTEPAAAAPESAGEPQLDLAPTEASVPDGEAKASSGNGQPPKRRGRPPRARTEAAPAPASESETPAETSEPAGS